MEPRLDENANRICADDECDEPHAHLRRPSEARVTRRKLPGEDEIDRTHHRNNHENNECPCVEVQSYGGGTVTRVAVRKVQSQLAKADRSADHRTQHAHAVPRGEGRRVERLASCGEQDEARTKERKNHRHALQNAEWAGEFVADILIPRRTDEHATHRKKVEVNQTERESAQLWVQAVHRVVHFIRGLISCIAPP